MAHQPHLTLLALVFLLLTLSYHSNCAFARVVSHVYHDKLVAASSFKLSLTSLDFSFPNSTLLQGMHSALHRSTLRLKHFQQSTASAMVTQASSPAGVTYQTPVFAGNGGFLTTASIGTPPVSFTAIVDTGSDLLWRQCKPCVHCYAQSSGTAIFDPSKSSTYNQASCYDALCNDLPETQCSSTSDSCTYIYSYGDGSFTSGDFSYDTLTLPDLSGRPRALPGFAFGCGHDNENSDFAGAGGLMGFGQGPLSLLSQLGIPKFSYCLQSISDPASRTSPLFIGAAAAIQSSSPSDTVPSTPIITNPSFPTYYYVRLNGISVGGKLAHIPPGTFDIQPDGSGGIIFDSGTTFTFLAEDGYNAVLSAFKSSIALAPLDGSEAGFELCYDRYPPKIPSLTFHFEGADMELPADNYFIAFNQQLFCLVFAQSSSISIFGNIQQQNFHVLYDREAQRLSFAPTACDAL